jgi:hypothetical protein
MTVTIFDPTDRYHNDPATPTTMAGIQRIDALSQYWALTPT